LTEQVLFEQNIFSQNSVRFPHNLITISTNHEWLLQDILYLLTYFHG